MKTKTDFEIRLDEATASDNKWNFWPDQMEIVKISVIDPDDTYGMLELGKKLGNMQAFRQIRQAEVPFEVVKVLGSRHANFLQAVYFTYARAAGQTDDPATRNILAVFEPKTDWDSTIRDYVVAGPGVVVELGCTHEYTTTRPFSMFTRSICDRCGHKVEVDSS